MKNNFQYINKETYEKAVDFAKESMNKNPQSYEEVVRNLEKHISGLKKILELGSGNGYVLKLLSEKGYDITGIEFSENRAELVKKTAPKSKVVIADFLDYNFGSQKYDVIIALAFIHLFPPDQLKKLLKKIENILNKNGLLVVSTSMEGKSEEGYQKRLDGLVRYRRKFTKEELGKILSNNDFEVLEFFTTPSLSGGITMNFVVRKC